MKRYVIASAVVGLFTSVTVTVVHAQPPTPVERLRTLMNSSQLCAPVKMGIKDLAKLVGVSLPALLPDTNIGIDKNDHEVTRADITDSTAAISGKYGCVPSDQAVPFQPPFNLKPSDFRLTDSFQCQGTIANKQVTAMACTNSGEIGKIIAGASDVNTQMKQLVQQML